MLRDILWVVLAYLAGSCLFGEWVPLRRGVDVMALSPDHNPGTANAFAYGGRRAGIEVLVLDILKGFLPVYLLRRAGYANDRLLTAVMIAPVLGHIFPVWTRFRGGKAIAVSFGVLLGLVPDWGPLLTLAACYILFSVLLCVETHLWRSVLTYACFAVIMLFERIPDGVTNGCLLISIAVAGKHLRARNGREPFSIGLPGRTWIQWGSDGEEAAENGRKQV